MKIKRILKTIAIILFVVGIGLFLSPYLEVCKFYCIACFFSATIICAINAIISGINAINDKIHMARCNSDSDLKTKFKYIHEIYCMDYSAIAELSLEDFVKLYEKGKNE